MSRRIEVELTSARPDGTWTWRAAGAREPKGVLEGGILPDGAKVGDVLRVDAEFGIDGIDIVHVLPPKGARKEPERIELLQSSTFDPVIQTLAPKGDRGPRRDRREGDRGDRDRRPRPEGGRPPRGDRPDGARGPRPEGGRPPRGDRPARPPRPEGEGRPERRDRRDRPFRPPVPEVPQRPKPKRLRPHKAHRTALLASLPDEHKPIAEQLLRGGVPAVRQALQEQNEKLKAAGQPEIKPGGVLALAEDLLPKVRVADWLDRADAAVADLDELDLRDLRSVVVAASDPMVARDESTRELSTQLKDGLNRRQDEEQREWLHDMEASLEVGRSVRALRLSSRPPKAGVPFPPELGTRLAEAASASLTADASTERWVAVLDALAYSPVRGSVVPQGVPDPVGDELRGTVARLAGLLPDIARRFGIEPPPPGSRAPRPPRPARRGDKPGGPKPSKPTPAKPFAPAATAAAAPTGDAAVTDTDAIVVSGDVVETVDVVVSGDVVETVETVTIETPEGTATETMDVVESPGTVEISSTEVVETPDGVEIETTDVVQTTEGIEIPTTDVVETTDLVEIATTDAIETSEVVETVETVETVEIAEDVAAEIVEVDDRVEPAAGTDEPPTD